MENMENLEYSGISLNMENSGNTGQPQGKTVTNKVLVFFSSSFKYLVRVWWWPVILLELMWNDPWWRSLLHLLFVAITYGKVSLWLWKSLQNSGNFFLLLCGHPDWANGKVFTSCCKMLTESAGFLKFICNINTVKECQQFFNFNVPSIRWLTRCKKFDVKYCESDNLLCKYLHLNKI